MSATEFAEIFEYSSFDNRDGIDLVPVVSVDLGGGYDWDEFHAWYSPSRRVYFWGSGSGCSCNSFTEDFRSLDDFENGRSRADVLAALNRYFDGQYLNHPKERAEALMTANQFSPRSAS